MYGVLMTPEQPERPPVPSNNSLPPPMSMAPPPPMEFNSREELLDYQKDWAERQGFAVVIGRSRPNRLWIKCDRGGEYSDKHLHDPENRKRKRKATRLTGCPFNIKATMKKDKIWRCYTEIGEHNHGPSEDLSIHPSLRRMTEEQLQKVNDMTENGNTPVETLEELQRLWPGIKVLRRDIYNARKKYKTEKELADFAKGANNTPTQTFEDPNGRIPGPTPNGRWMWLEEGDEIKRKKRKKSSINGTQQAPPPPPPPPSAPPQQANLAPELRDQNQQAQVSASTGARRQRATPNSTAVRPNFQPPQPSPVPPQQMPPTMRPPEQDFAGNVNQPNRSPDQFRHYNPATGPPPRQPYRAPSQPGANEPLSQSHPHMQQGHPQGPPRGPPQGGPQGPQGQPLRPRGMADTMPVVSMISPINSANGNTNQQQPQQQQQQQTQSQQQQQQSQQQSQPQSTSATTASSGSNTKHQSGQVLMSRIERMEKEQRDQKAILSQILGAVQGMNGMRR